MYPVRISLHSAQRFNGVITAIWIAKLKYTAARLGFEAEALVCDGFSPHICSRRTKTQV